MAAAECEARGPTRRFQYMWADTGISGFSRLAALNPARWSSSMKLNRLIEELESLSSSRPLRLYMTSDEEQLNREFDSVSDALQWLRAQFPRDANEALEEAPAEGGWSLFGSCLQPSVAEPELEVVPPSNAEHDDGEHDTPDSPAPADEASPSSASTAATPAGHGLEGEAKVQYMWADARVLPIKAIQELSRHNPARWSKAQRPLDLAEELEAMDTMRPVLLSLSTSRGQLQRRFHSAAAAAQWLRSSCCGDMQRLDEERLCVICLTAARTVMLMPCRHAVLCERCLEVLMERTPSSCPVCRQRIQNHARGHFVDDYVELVRALEMRMERSQMAAYEGMYNHIRPLMVTGALLATGAAACFVVCPPAAPALLAGAGVVGYLPWFATTVANFEEEPVEQRTQQIFTAEDWASPLTLGVKGVVLLVAAPVALTVFFVPYGLYAGVLRPVGRLLGRLALRGAVALHVSVLRHVPALLRGMADGAVALGNLLGDVLGVTAQAIYDWILAPSWSGLRWLASKAAAGASWIYANALVPLGRALQGCGAAAWHGMESAGSAVYHQVLAPLGRLLARGAEAFYALALVPAASAIWTGLQGLWNQVLLPTAGATWQGLKILGRALSVAAEWTYGSVLRPLAGEPPWIPLDPCGFPVVPTIGIFGLFFRMRVRPCLLLDHRPLELRAGPHGWCHLAGAEDVGRSFVLGRRADLWICAVALGRRFVQLPLPSRGEWHHLSGGRNGASCGLCVERGRLWRDTGGRCQLPICAAALGLRGGCRGSGRLQLRAAAVARSRVQCVERLRLGRGGGGRRLLPISAAPRGFRRGRSGPGHLQLRAVALWSRRDGSGQLCGAGHHLRRADDLRPRPVPRGAAERRRGGGHRPQPAAGRPGGACGVPKPAPGLLRRRWQGQGLV